jgi:hypothetical protein
MDLSGRAKAVGGEPRLPYRSERRPTEPQPTVAAPQSHVYWRRHPRRRQLSFIAFLKSIDHCSYLPCRVRCPFPAERRPKFISVTVPGARFWECSTRSNWFNLYGNCYKWGAGALRGALRGARRGAAGGAGALRGAQPRCARTGGGVAQGRCGGRCGGRAGALRGAQPRCARTGGGVAQGRCGGRRGAAGGAAGGAQGRCGGRSHAAPIQAAGWHRGAARGRRGNGARECRTHLSQASLSGTLPLRAARRSGAAPGGGGEAAPGGYSRPHSFIRRRLRVRPCGGTDRFR